MKIEDKIIFVMAGNSTTINARNISCFVKVIGDTSTVQTWAKAKHGEGHEVWGDLTPACPLQWSWKVFGFHCWRTWSQIVGRDGFVGGGWFVFSFLYRACSIKTLPTALISFLPASSLPSPLLVLCLLFLFLNMIGKWEEEVLLSVHTAVSRPSYGVSRALVVRLGLGV